MNALTVGDYAVVVVYMVMVTAVGIWAHAGNKTTKDFLFAGKTVGWLPMGISIAAAFISGISYMGLPAEIYSYGLGFMLYVFAYVLVIPVILYVFLPFYGRLPITTAYEYLEARFDRRVRQFCSGMFIVWRLLWIATVIYVPSLLVATVTGLPMLTSVFAIGLVTTVYTAFGGLRGVIWTDVVQFFVMVGGALVAIQFTSLAVPGGLSGIWNVAAENGRTQFIDLSLDLTSRMTLWGALIGGFFANLAFFGVDQMVIQRYLATRSALEMRSTFLLNCVALLVVTGVLAALGLALFSFYRVRPGGLEAGVSADRVLPYFIATEFPAGLRGLLVASIFAASMSTLSAGVNAVTTAIFNDFAVPSRPRDLRFVRMLSLGVGAFCTLLASMVGTLGSIMEIAVRVIDGFAGPLLAVFLLGMLTAQLGPVPVLIGACVGLLTTTAANFFSPISFVWFPAIGCLVSMAVAFVAQPWFRVEEVAHGD